MTDEENPDSYDPDDRDEPLGGGDPHPLPEHGEHGPPSSHGPSPSPSANGVAPASRPTVRSGLAHRRNPVLTKLAELAQNAQRIALRDPLALVLAIASLGLAIAFASLLGDI